MTDEVLRKAGLFITAGIMLVGLWLTWSMAGDLSGMFIAVTGSLWFVSDWSSFNQRRTKSKPDAQAASPLGWRCPGCGRSLSTIREDHEALHDFCWSLKRPWVLGRTSESP
jgi:hypothetical protein